MNLNQCTGQSIEYLSVADYYGCIHGTIECYWVNGQGVRCYNTALSPSACGRYCHTDGTDCYYGDCTDDCTDDGLTYTLTQSKATPLHFYDTYYGCFHERENGVEIMCEVNSGRYMCYKDGKYCGTDCQKDGTDCSSHSSCEDCPAGTERFETQTISACARPDGVYCIVMYNVPGQYACYMPDQTLCAERCYDFADNCQNGTCNSSDCPSGTYFQLQDGTSQFYGCYNPDTDLFCRMVYTPNGGIHCWKNGLLCGTQCTDYNGNGDTCTDCQTQFTCPDGMTETTYIYASDKKEYNACRKENLVCLNNAAQTCYLSDKRCGEQCDPDGQNCRTGACTAQDANCPNGFVYALNPYYSGNIYGCTSYSQNLSCVYINGTYRCYKNGSVCGSGCSLDGTGCTTGVCAAADCPNGQEPVYDTSDAFKCGTVDKTVSCSGTTNSYTCSINNNICGYNCADEQGSSCQQGICRPDECPDGFTLDYITSGTYGCTNPETLTQCFRTGSSYTCWKNGSLCGESCSISGTGGSCDTGCV